MQIPEASNFALNAGLKICDRTGTTDVSVPLERSNDAEPKVPLNILLPTIQVMLRASSPDGAKTSTAQVIVPRFVTSEKVLSASFTEGIEAHPDESPCVRV